ncbi:MAG: GNAT family N-acetyltransferase [Xanthomonadales bacterium]|nr:GNAT family N-acetyltransferase [Xanthomonadales bacterium]
MDLTSIPRILKTDNLQLRPSNSTDAEGMFAMLSDPQSMKYWSDQPISNLDAAIEVLQQDLESDAQGNSMCWAITFNGQDKMIGKCILFQFSRDKHRAEIGYILNRKYWRQGLTHQALGAVIDFAFSTLKLHRIEADVDTENTASIGLLEKLGFKREGLFRERWRVYDKWQDSLMLGLLKKDWLENL